MNKDLISGFDLTPQDIAEIFRVTRTLKKKKYSAILNKKVIGLVFEKPSMRTRVSFEVGAHQLGARCLYLAPQDIKLGEREPIKDVARVLARYVDGIVARTFSHAYVEEFAELTDISVINGLSDMYHPCQALGDMYTIYERHGTCKGIKLAFVGDGNNVVHSLLAIAAKTGMHCTVATPKGYEPDASIWAQAADIAKLTGSRLTHTYDPREAVKGADYIYTDVWTSMGQEQQRKQRLRDFKSYQVNAALLKSVGKEYAIMHCMPVHRGEEITDEAMESPQSIVFDQAENRMHVQKAIMALLMGKRRPSKKAAKLKR
ncbi:MAG: ornithine carbamoyltransferase [Candidatus Omnitrophica bacterium]|nr:ornithine carbamoyltransferase [Candidatus Omnitrophota bacterium]